MKFKHLEEVKEGYFKHMYEAFKISFDMFRGAFCVIIHGIYPDCFVKTATDICLDIVKRRKKIE